MSYPSVEVKSLKTDLSDEKESEDRSRACRRGFPEESSPSEESGGPQGGGTDRLRCLSPSPSEEEGLSSSDLGDCLLVDFFAGLPEVCLPERCIVERGGGPRERGLLRKSDAL